MVRALRPQGRCRRRGASHVVRRIEAGHIDADLGGGIIKQRVARLGKGKSGGYRTIVACRVGDRAVFLHGFSKSDRANIDDADLERLKSAAKQVLSWDEAQVATQLKSGAWIEIDGDV